MNRRDWIRATVLGTATALVSRRALGLAPAPIKMTVYKSPTCGCCKQWVAHVRENGFEPVVHDMPSVDPIKMQMGIPRALQSCHTAVVGKYAIEGHVPADVIKKMLAEKPTITGLAVPGMPQGSPGMETGRKEAYEIIAFEKGGKTRVYAKR